MGLGRTTKPGDRPATGTIQTFNPLHKVKGGMRCMEAEVQKIQERKGLIKLVAVASIAAGVQFGWALQLSLLTPYVQLLGIPHEWASLIWLCGPISGLLVQPTVGYFSDRCTSRFGRRRPFIVSGSALAALSVFCIGFAADIGMATGDKLSVGIKPRAFVLFIVGFWILNVANNMLQGPLRAFLADLSDGDSSQVRLSNALYSFFMAVGNVAGFGAGSCGNLYKIMPFTFTVACDVYCANLKALFIISIALLLSLTVIALCLVKEERFHHTPSDDKDSEGDDGVITAFGKLPRSMRALMLVTALNWIGWFPFVLYDTDWMGKEVYGGETKSENYADGVRAGALGLTLQSLTLSVVSLLIDPLSRLVRMNRLWAAANFVLASGLALTAAVTNAAASHRHQYGSDSPPTLGIKASALSLFVLLGFPLAVTFSIPFALASIYSHSAGAGQGLSLAILNLAIVIPQTLVSFLSGPWDSLFGGGNFPAFAVGAIAAGISSVLAWTVLPEPSSLDYTSDSEDDYQI